ncbi:MAG: hypothetical protein VW239_09020, partial [Candidatus Nanopelagicales bacterium]
MGVQRRRVRGLAAAGTAVAIGVGALIAGAPAHGSSGAYTWLGPVEGPTAARGITTAGGLQLLSRGDSVTLGYIKNSQIILKSSPAEYGGAFTEFARVDLASRGHAPIDGFTLNAGIEGST